MKLKLLYIIGILLLLLALARCKPDDKPLSPVHYYYWLEEAKDYMYFKKGSWWVYINTENGQMDTLYCTSDRLDTITVQGTSNHSKHRTLTYEHSFFRLISSRFGNYYEYYYGGKFPDGTDAPSQESKVFIKTKSPAGKSDEAFRFPLLESEMVEPDGWKKTLQRVKDTSMTIQGRTYTNIQIIRNYRMSTFDYLLEPNNDKIFEMVESYYAPGYGLIKMTELNSNKNIELLDSYIIQ